MFQSNFRVIFRLIFEQVECAFDNVFSSRDLVLQVFVTIIVIGEYYVFYIIYHNYFNQFLKYEIS